MGLNIVRSVKILGTGSYFPERVIDNLELEQHAPTSDAWIQCNLGIKSRRRLAPHQATSDLAKEAAQGALADAGLHAEELDLIIVATATPDRLAPSTACILQDKIGAYNAAAFDLAAVCSGFLYGLSVGAQFIAAHVYDNVLIVGADAFSRITNWNDRSCVYFGDGAGAAILTHTREGEGLLAIDLYADGRGKFSFTVPAGGSELPASLQTVACGLHNFVMKGKAVFETATTVLPDAISKVLSRCGLTIDDVDLLIPHQPSINILKVTAEKLNLPFEKVMTNMDRYANTAGASVAALLDEANHSGRLRDGSIIVLAAVGSGWTWSAGVIRWINRKIQSNIGFPNRDF
jgi:3-oxoacyl-[acyl-carrier-protein] synthase-3